MTDPLASWNDGITKRAILDFVENVTNPTSPMFVPPDDRIATFDNDGTLWVEQPIDVRASFVFDRIKEIAPQHPEWENQEPFASVLQGDLHSVLTRGEYALMEMMLSIHADMTIEEFETSVKEWLVTAKHPTTQRPYNEMIYQPMLELLTYLQANDFKIFIVPEGEVEFMRPWTEQIYGIPPAQVIRSNKAGKPAAIQHYIGQRPIAAFGNSDGDLEMLWWTSTLTEGSLKLIVHHTDADREFAYDQGVMSSLKQALAETKLHGWVVVDMKNDWKRIFAFDQEVNAKETA